MRQIIGGRGEDLFKDVYGLKQCNLTKYFDEVQIQQNPNYAYGEEIAIIDEKSKDSFSISRSYERFTEWLVDSLAPWQRTEREIITSEAQYNSVLVVHGHDNGSKNDLANFLFRLGLKPIILQDRKKEGLTLIEQFEKYYFGVRYAIILFTPDNVGAKNKREPTLRAHQNMILAMSYLMGKLGRNKILCLLKGDMEAPSEVQGILFLRYKDKVEERYTAIVSELTGAGYNIPEFSGREVKINRYGWVRDLPDHKDFMYGAPMQVLSSLPSKVDLIAHCPRVYDQGNLGSATANAVAAAIEYDLMKEKIRHFIPSRLFIYYNARSFKGTVNSDSGAQIRDSIRSVASLGVCDENQWPYHINKFAEKPPQRCYDDAVKFKAVQYQRVIRDLNQMKACLASGYPILFGFAVYQSFERQEVAKTGHVAMPSSQEHVISGHAVLAVGYDDSQNWFIARNSWGTNWGMKGYFTIPYSYLLNMNLSDDFWTLRVVT